MRTFLLFCALWLVACAATISPKLSTTLQGKAGQAVFFDASQTEAPESDYFWDFGDGSKGTGKQVYHVYTAPGNYKAKLRVKGGGKKGIGLVAVSIAQPTALAVFPKNSAAAIIVDNLPDYRSAWDFFKKLPELSNELTEAERMFERNLGFFPLNADALRVRGLDPERGMGIAWVSPTQGTPLLAVGMLAGDTGMLWLKEALAKAGLSLQEDSYQGSKIYKFSSGNNTNLYASVRAGFLLLVPVLSTEEDALAVLQSALASKEALADAEWVKKLGVRQFYLQGGSALSTFSDQLRKMREPELELLGMMLSPISLSLDGFGISMSTQGGTIEVDVASMLSKDGLALYQKLSPMSSLLSIDQSLAEKSFLYSVFRLDLAEAARQGSIALSSSDRAAMQEALSGIESFLGVNVKTLVDAFGTSGAVILSLDGQKFVDTMSGNAAPTMPGELYVAYEVKNKATISQTLDKLVSMAQLFGGAMGISVSRQPVVGHEAVRISVAGFHLGWVLQEKLFLFAVGSEPSVLEKAAELISHPQTAAKPLSASAFASTDQRLVINMKSLLEILEAIQKSNSSKDEMLDTTISLLSSIQRVSVSLLLQNETLHTKFVVEHTSH